MLVIIVQRSELLCSSGVCGRVFKTQGPGPFRHTHTHTLVDTFISRDGLICIPGHAQRFLTSSCENVNLTHAYVNMHLHIKSCEDTKARTHTHTHTHTHTQAPILIVEGPVKKETLKRGRKGEQ